MNWYDCKEHGSTESAEPACHKCTPVTVCEVCQDNINTDDESAICEICDKPFHWLDCGGENYTYGGGIAVCDNCTKKD